MDFTSIIDQIKEFLRQIFTLEFLQQIRDAVLQLAEYIKEFIEWLYNSISGLWG